jgi:hypothetical protein
MDVSDPNGFDGWSGCPAELLVEPSDVDFAMWEIGADGAPDDELLASLSGPDGIGGPADAATRARLESIDAEQLCDYDLVDYLRAWSAQVASAQARLLDGIDELSRRCTGPLRIGGAAEIACALRISRPAAEHLRATARQLATRLPRTQALFAAGEIGLAHATGIADETSGLDRDTCAQVEEQVAGRAPAQTHGQLRAATRRAVAVADPEAFAARHRRRHRDETDVTRHDYVDAMGQLSVTGPLADIAIIDTAVRAWAETHRRDLPQLTAGQRRVAALVDWAARFLGAPDAPTRHGRPVTIDLVMNLSTALRLDNTPAELVGYGPIPAETARALAADGTLRRLITDPRTGRLIDCGTRRYTPDVKTRDFLLARERVSGFPGATTPADRCDLDHTVPYQHGGPTDPTNLGPLDRHAHRVKTLTAWTVTRTPTGDLDWTSPAGHTYRVEPHDYRLGP